MLWESVEVKLARTRGLDRCSGTAPLFFGWYLVYHISSWKLFCALFQVYLIWYLMISSKSSCSSYVCEICSHSAKFFLNSEVCYCLNELSLFFIDYLHHVTDSCLLCKELNLSIQRKCAFLQTLWQHILSQTDWCICRAMVEMCIKKYLK